MSTFKKHPIIMLPTTVVLESNIGVKNMVGKLVIVDGNGLALVQKDWTIVMQHLYVTSDESIKDGDWFIGDNTSVKQCTINNGGNINFKGGWYSGSSNCRKIIATSDAELFKLEDCPVRGATSSIKYTLPKSTKDFVRKYITSYNKSKIISEVLVEYETIKTPSEVFYNNDVPYNSIKLKVHTETNTINIKKIQESWNREGVAAVLRDYDKDKQANIEWYIENKL